MMEQGFKKLKEIAQQMKVDRDGGLAPSQHTTTARDFISWFGFQRRTTWFVEKVREELESCGLHTDPDFQNAYIDGNISILDSSVSMPPADSTLRVDTLPAAHNGPVTVTPEDELKKATTLMLINDFSHIPVMPNKRDVKGTISWQSIGTRSSLGQTGDKVSYYMDSPQIIYGRQPLFEAVSTIADHGYVLVRGKDQIITGIVTASDLNDQFLQLAEPFLLLGEIESHVRRVIHGKFTSEELMTTKGASDDEIIDELTDLTFGNYCRLLEDAERWNRLNLGVDQKVFVSQLDEIRKVRNDVMHFSPDGLDPKDIEKLRRMAEFLQHLAHSGGP